LLHGRHCRNVGPRKGRRQPKSDEQAGRKQIEQVRVWQGSACPKVTIKATRAINEMRRIVFMKNSLTASAAFLPEHAVQQQVMKM
jgi:hypothetical protein